MRVSTKGRYGVRAMFELARNYGSYPVSVKTIAEQQEISIPYLEQILNQLSKARLVRSVKGPGGGFLLAKKPEDIKIIDIILALGETVNPVFCVEDLEDNQCHRAPGCVARLFWKKLGNKLREVLENTTLKDLCEWAKEMSGSLDHEYMFYI